MVRGDAHVAAAGMSAAAATGTNEEPAHCAVAAEDGVPLIVALMLPHAGLELLLALASCSRACRARVAALVSSRLRSLHFSAYYGRAEYPRERESDDRTLALHYHDSMLALCEGEMQQVGALVQDNSGTGCSGTQLAPRACPLGTLCPPTTQVAAAMAAVDGDVETMAQGVALWHVPRASHSRSDEVAVLDALAAAERWEIPHARSRSLL